MENQHARQSRKLYTVRLVLVAAVVVLGARFFTLAQNAVTNFANLIVLNSQRSGSDSELRLAHPALEWAVNVNPASVSILRSLALVCEALEDQACWESWLLKELQISPGNVLAEYRLGALYDSTNRRNKAIAMWRQAEAAPFFFYRALLEQSQGKTEQALDDLDIAIQTAPNVSDAYYLRATIYELRADWRNARLDYEKAVQNQNFTWRNDEVWLARAYIGLGYTTYQDTKNLDPAVSALYSAIEIDPNEGWSYIRLCDIYRLAGQPITASKWCDKAVQRMPDQQWSFFSRGRAYMQLGEYELAARDFEMTLAIAPTYAPAKVELERARKLISQK